MFKRLLFAASVFFVLLFMNFNLYPADLLVGGKAFYANWTPYVKDLPAKYPAAKGQGWEMLETGGGWMYGPSAGMTITDDLSISVSYMYGNLLSKFDGTSNTSEQWGNQQIYVTTYTSGYAEVKRQDIDAAISYNVYSFFKIFGGFKYQPLKMKVKQGQLPYVDFADNTNNTDGFRDYKKAEMIFKSVTASPALGIGISLPFADMFAFTANISALYLTGGMTVTRYDQELSDSPDDPHTFKAEMDISGWGVNVEPALMCVMKENIILQVGFRYQMMKMSGDFDVKTEETSGGGPKDASIKGMQDSVYGVTFTLLYRFGL